MKSIILTIAITISAITIFAQSITNIAPAQRTDGSMIVDITYDLAGPEPDYIITVETSFDNGATFVQIDSVSGDVGAGIIPGNGKVIEWDFGSEFPDQFSATTQIRITASLVLPWNCGYDFVDDRDSQTYTTVQIGTQCWMAENLNIGTMVNGYQDQQNNGTIEKYCYDNDPANCNTYGGLYQWREMMQYTTTQGVQGICPPDWHLPTDAEWMVLEEEVESTTGVNWDTTGWRGTDAGGNLKEVGTTHWLSPNNGATNSSGFTGLPGGYRYTNGTFDQLTYDGYFWSSSEYGSSAWRRGLNYDNAQVARHYTYKTFGFSVRCVRN
jgi:uncharacterized protein (TIGR02145 family)